MGGASFHHPKPKDITIDGVLYALSDPTRRNIVTKLMNKPGMNCRKTCLDMAPSTVSFHYKVLRESGLIKSEKKGVEVVNTLRKADIDKRFPKLLESILRHHILLT
jgi:DNA-binding transcriptional ArsR family regulator